MPQPKTFGNLPLHSIRAYMLESDADRYAHQSRGTDTIVKRFTRHVRAGGAAVELFTVVVRYRLEPVPSIPLGEIVHVCDATQGGVWLTIEVSGTNPARQYRVHFPRWAAWKMKESVGGGQWSGLYHQAVMYDGDTETITFAAGTFSPGRNQLD